MGTETSQQEMPVSEEDKKDIEANKGITVLSYIGLLFLIPLLARKESKFAKFHAKQGLVLCIGWLFVWVPVVGWMLGFVLAIFAIWGIVNVLGGKYKELPLVGELAKKFNI